MLPDQAPLPSTPPFPGVESVRWPAGVRMAVTTRGWLPTTEPSARLGMIASYSVVHPSSSRGGPRVWAGRRIPPGDRIERRQYRLLVGRRISHVRCRRRRAPSSVTSGHRRWTALGPSSIVVWSGRVPGDAPERSAPSAAPPPLGSRTRSAGAPRWLGGRRIDPPIPGRSGAQQLPLSYCPSPLRRFATRQRGRRPSCRSPSAWRCSAEVGVLPLGRLGDPEATTPSVGSLLLTPCTRCAHHHRLLPIVLNS